MTVTRLGTLRHVSAHRLSHAEARRIAIRAQLLDARRPDDLLSMGDGDPYRTDERGIADLGDVLIAWFRDPDDQVISVFQLK